MNRQTLTLLTHFEELLPQREEILRSGGGRQVPCRNLPDSSLDSALKDRDCAELPVQEPITFFVSTLSKCQVSTDQLLHRENLGS